MEKRNDDLTRIEGIGPKMAGVLKNAGVPCFDSLANADPAEVKNVLNEASLQMMNTEGWIEQAEFAAKEEHMFSVYFLEEAAGGSGSIWVPVLVLGWFLLMTLVGWQVSRGNAPTGNGPQTPDTTHSDNNSSEFDTH